MAKYVRMPRQGQSVESCIITKWFKHKGDPVKEGDLLYSYETDKAAFDEFAENNGILLDIFFGEGEEVPVLETIAVIGEPGEYYSVTDAVERSQTVGSSGISISENEDHITIEPGSIHEIDGGIIRQRISPRARNMASKLNLDISTVRGTGPNGRIIAGDIERALQEGSSRFLHVLDPASGYEERPVSNIRRIIASRMSGSLRESAQLTHHANADARKILKLRKEIKEGSEKRYPVSTTINDMVCFAIIKALTRHQGINAHFLGDRIRYFSGVHLGIAVDTPRGLMVPVARNADRLNLSDLGLTLARIADDCREGKIAPDLLDPELASFTVSNLGAYGIEMFTPVLNLPQCGILGINAIALRPAQLEDATVGFIPHIGLSLTYDHRAIDGAPASRFLMEVCNLIKDFDQII